MNTTTDAAVCPANPIFTPSALAAVALPATGVAVVGTPLGNKYDVTLRQAAVLGRAQVIAAEDTRRVRSLAAAIGVSITGTVISNFDHNEDQRKAQLLALARTNLVAVVTDAGMPVVADPGYTLVAAAHDAGIPVTVIPGPSAVTTALAGAGLPAGGFRFVGFAPRKPAARTALFQSHIGAGDALVVFESPHRIAATLAVAREVFGDQQPAAVCRELTKTYEEYRRGSLAELCQWAAAGVKGEITLIIGPAAAVDEEDPASLVAQAESLVAEGMKLKAACRQVTEGTTVSKNDLYDAVLAARNEIVT
ncbi:16S rRNA (cytidine(1402)-2'-O)-methyltransferase [Corynebacterium choanae]|uniref:Ribosomal RNA small subunit methyltransferase I n=1 Tax=Corynebacterium choanae TaxID=1862358 RepID=A0A3G6J5A1_9CORY|nr:16S rRNA (cytidine(1402)-2'-O)-methyltransferase [Corynebacterium choanae]AZA13119.1 Ribosomal RNA small subunit methyltransferase I [Corynebacterium choanae]